ncbi:hypothetical protein [Hypericibacter sp.]|uniref:hypothetical protein n=1 Tax=Hypericibacter sp. TaxID=2705401 RepID=UPI003D6D7422
MKPIWSCWRRRAAVAAIALLVGACSTVDYGKPVNDFAAATNDAESALSQLNVQVTEAYSEVLKNSVVSGRAFVKTNDEECLTLSVRCRLIIQAEDGTKEIYPPAPPLAQMTLLMAQINKYAGNLKALLEADTATKVETQVNAALGSVQNLAETVAAAGGGSAATVPQFATPVGAGINWIVGQYVEHVKLSGLQRATAAAKPVIRDAAGLFTAASTFASDVPKSELAEEVSQAVDTFREGSNASNFDRLVQSTVKYDALLVSTPPQLFQRMAAAHDALADSLQDKNLTFATALARIEAFAAEAKKLVTILQDLRAVTSNNP